LGVGARPHTFLSQLRLRASQDDDKTEITRWSFAFRGHVGAPREQDSSHKRIRSSDRYSAPSAVSSLSTIDAGEAILVVGNLALRPASDEIVVEDRACPLPLALAHEAFQEGRRPMPLWRDRLLGRCRARDGIDVSLYLRLRAIKQRSKILPRRTNRDHREMTPTVLTGAQLLGPPLLLC
jgi:hypothetical protein